MQTTMGELTDSQLITDKPAALPSQTHCTDNLKHDDMEFIQLYIYNFIQQRTQRTLFPMPIQPESATDTVQPSSLVSVSMGHNAVKISLALSSLI